MTEFNLSDTEELIRDLITKNKELKTEVSRMNTLLNVTSNLLKQASGAEYQRGYEEGFAEGRKRTELSELQDDEIRVGDVVAYSGQKGSPSMFVVFKFGDGNNGYRYVSGYNYEEGEWDGCYEYDLKKIGRHIDAAEKLLEELSNEH